MRFAEHLGASLAVVAIAAMSTSAPAKEAKQPKKTGRLSVSVTKVGPKTPVSQPVTIKARASWRGPKAQFTYEWQSVAGPPLPGSVDVTDKAITLPAGSLDPGEKYHFRVIVTARTQAEGEDDEALVIRAAKDVKFAANEPPSGGQCTIQSKKVTSNVLRVHLAAPGWTDPDGQVQYRLEVVKGDRVVARQNWRLFSTFTAAVRLRPGESVFGRCHIRDKYGDGGMVKTRSVSADSP